MSPTPTDRHRVLVLIKGLGIGGAEMLISEASSLWDRDRFDYQVAYALPWKDQLVERIEANDVPVSMIGTTKGMRPATVANLRGLVAKWKPDIIHSHLPATSIMARTTVTGVEHVYTEHNIASSYRQPTRALNRLTYGRNRAVIAVSDAVATSLVGYPGPQPTVIPNGVAISVSTEEARTARTSLELDSGDPLFVHVGNIRPHKGHSNLIRATGLLKESLPDVTVVSIGGEKHPGDLERVRREARDQGLEGQIRFLGRRDDARSFIAAADAIVNPADVEGLPVSLLEALALARPVVATSVGGVPSVVHHEQSGLLVPPDDPESLAAAMLRVIEDPEAKLWGEEGARIVEENFGLQQMIDSYESLYSKILGT